MTHPARKLLTALRNAQAFGPLHAVAQRVLAGRTGIPVRRLQEDVVLELLAEGYAIATTCREPYGLFIPAPRPSWSPIAPSLKAAAKACINDDDWSGTSNGACKPPKRQPASPPAEESGQLLIADLATPIPS